MGKYWKHIFRNQVLAKKSSLNCSSNKHNVDFLFCFKLGRKKRKINHLLCTFLEQDNKTVSKNVSDKKEQYTLKRCQQSFCVGARIKNNTGSPTAVTTKNPTHFTWRIILLMRIEGRSWRRARKETGRIKNQKRPCRDKQSSWDKTASFGCSPDEAGSWFFSLLKLSASTG